MTDTVRVRNHILEQIAELTERARRIHSDLKSSHSADWEEQAIERENDEVLEQLEGELQHDLAQWQQALARLDEGQYGVCEVCQQPIAEARLQALPSAVRCINCAS